MLSLLNENKSLILYYFIIINIVAFIIYGFDKLFAIKHKWRISVNTLLGLGLLGGSIGGYLSMKLFHHKTNKKLFTIGIPLLMIIHLVIIIYILILKQR